MKIFWPLIFKEGKEEANNDFNGKIMHIIGTTTEWKNERKKALALALCAAWVVSLGMG